MGAKVSVYFVLSRPELSNMLGDAVIEGFMHLNGSSASKTPGSGNLDSSRPYGSFCVMATVNQCN
jgi:hypothetical protein